MFENYGIEIAQLFKKAEQFRKSLKHPYVGSEHLLLAILESDNDVSRKLKLYGLTFERFKEELIHIVGTATKETNFVLYTPLLKRIIESATNDAIENNKGKVTERHLFLSLLDEGEGVAIRILVGMDIDLEEIYDEFKYSFSKEKKGKLTLFEIGTNLNTSVDSKEKVLNREEELSLVIESLLRKKKSNPLLIGKAGVGKTAIVEELARRINQGLVPKELLNKTIVMLEMGSLVSGTKYRGEFEERLTKIIKEVLENKEIILFIDEIHTMINAGGAEGAINAADILKPYLARGELRCIGATTMDEYYNSIYKDKALERRFYKIQVEEPDIKKTEEILKGIKKEYELHHHIKISDQNIVDIVYYADKYIKNKCNPDKSIDLLDMVCASMKVKDIPFMKLDKMNQEIRYFQKEKQKAICSNDYESAVRLKEQENLLCLKKEDLMKKQKDCMTKEDILFTLEQKANIPLLENKEALFKTIQKNLQEQIIGQNKAIKQILKNIWIKLQGSNRPLALLLNGPSGVGKTKTVKTIAESIKKSNFLRLDMSEYNLETSVNKLIGVSQGYVGYEDAYLFRSILENPYSILLVDEIEKAHPRVLNLFLQILDEGFITSAKGEKIDFSNTMIFMTSNVVEGKSVGFIHKENHTIHDTFSKEFLGRFQDQITFDAFTKEIVTSYLNKHLTNKNVDIEKILQESEWEKYGLRNMNHLILKYNNEIELEIPL